MVTIRECLNPDGRSPYAKWFNRLNAPAAAKVATAKVFWKEYKGRKRQEQ